MNEVNAIHDVIRRRRWVLGIVLLLVLAAGVFAHSGSTHSENAEGSSNPSWHPFACGSPYDTTFYEAAATYMDPDWLPFHCWLPAQAKAESNFDPNAVSPAGAQGLSQFLPGTWTEVTRRYGITGSVWDAHASASAQAAYLNRLGRFWKFPRPASERLRLATASYNAGPGNIHKAQVKCIGSMLWHEMQPCLVQVTGKHSVETTQYVERIERFYLAYTGRELP